MYKCENCRVRKDDGSEVYLVENVFMDRYLPTCSKECSEAIREREINRIQKILDRMKNAEIKKRYW